MDQKAKRINCVLHDTMRFSARAMAIIDTPHFQRLRDLRQLGLTSFIFPTANHTRFDHSLGVCYLAEQWARRLQHQSCPDSYRINEQDIECVALAGLCHDLGHGPFSHVFDHEFLSRLNITDFVHEEMSCSILHSIVEGMDESLQLPDEQVETICDMIKIDFDARKKMEERGDERRFLFDIVSNKVNSVDVDKFDYLARDSRFTNVPISFRHDRVFNYSRVVANEICYKRSEYPMIHKLFVSREDMHRAVYTHPKAKSIEFLVCDALVAADPLLRFSERIRNVDDFLTMDDTIVKQIESFRKNTSCLKRRVELDDDEEAALEKSLALIKRFRNRENYRYVGEQKIPPKLYQKGETGSEPAVESILRDFRPEEIMSCYSPSMVARSSASSPQMVPQVKLNRDDIICSVNKVDYSMKDLNPLDKVKFFSYFENEAQHIPATDASHMMASNFQEKTLRVYSKDRNKDVKRALEAAFAEVGQ